MKNITFGGISLYGGIQSGCWIANQLGYSANPEQILLWVMHVSIVISLVLAVLILPFVKRTKTKIDDEAVSFFQEFMQKLQVKK